MSSAQKYLDILNKTHEIALATSVGDMPNVRIVNIVVKKERPGVLYFASDRTTSKVAEFAKNSNVAFTSIPHDDAPHVRSNKAFVKKSALGINDLRELFVKEIPGYDQILDEIGDTFDVFEIHVKEIFVIESFDTAPETITFELG